MGATSYEAQFICSESLNKCLLSTLIFFCFVPVGSPFAPHILFTHLHPSCPLLRSGFCLISPCSVFMPHIMTHIIRLTVCTTLFSTNCCTDGRGKAQMGRGQFFIGCSVPRRPTHLVCSEKHLCTNLFVTIY